MLCRESWLFTYEFNDIDKQKYVYAWTKKAKRKIFSRRHFYGPPCIFSSDWKILTRLGNSVCLVIVGKWRRVFTVFRRLVISLSLSLSLSLFLSWSLVASRYFFQALEKAVVREGNHP